MNLLFLLFLSVWYQAEGTICSIELINRTKKYLFIQVQSTRVKYENSNGETVNAELDFGDKEKVFYKCADPNGHARVKIAEVMDGRFTEYPYMQDVFGNKTYNAVETRIKSVRLRPTSNSAYTEKSDVEDEILEIKKRLDGQMELIDRLIDVEVAPGPQGPQGPQGPPGPEGPAGECDVTLKNKVDEMLRLQTRNSQAFKLQNDKMTKLEADFEQRNREVQSQFDELRLYQKENGEKIEFQSEKQTEFEMKYEDNSEQFRGELERLRHVQSGCLTGCPCPNYVCPGQKTTSASTTTTASTTSTTANTLTSVLILNSASSSNVPLIVDGQGRSRQALFEYEQDTESYCSCSLLWKGQFYVFGGWNKKDQVSKVSGCRLERVGTLRFELFYGGCATDPEDNIYLCFGEAATKTCRKGENPTGDFTQIAQSTYEHKDTRVSASSEFLFAVGSYSPSNNKAELFSFDKESWETTTSYPNTNGISLVFILNKGEDFFIFGGLSRSESDKIVKFTTTTENWTQIGSLNKARQGHGVIQTGESFLVVGGWSGVYPTEKCDFDQPDKMTCVTMEPTLSDLNQYPELLLVEADYCT